MNIVDRISIGSNHTLGVMLVPVAGIHVFLAAALE